MNILIVDDNQVKAEKLAGLILQSEPSAEIVHATTAHGGFGEVESRSFNLVLLDVVIPMGPEQPPSEEGSMWFVREAQRKLPSASLPLIVGTTQYFDSVAKVEETFRQYLWTVVYVGDADEHWQRQISYAVRFARPKAERHSLSTQSGTGSVGDIDVALVTALRMPEFVELMDSLGGGDPYFIEETGENWLHCKLDLVGGRQANVMAACADEMGMPAMSALVTRLCVMCRPRKLVLAGIMGGNSERVALTDLVVINETWNANAGKLTEKGFEPDLKVQRCSHHLANLVKLIVSDDLLVKLWQGWKGDKPRQFPELHTGAVACSNSVIADGQFFAELEDHKRKIHGVEMEAFGCYDAVDRLGRIAPKVICIKSVCDLGDKTKSDKYQRFCAHLSAAVCVSLVKSERFLDSDRTP